MLRALVLAGDDDVGGKMGKPHGGIGFIDVLPARAAGAIGIDAQIGLVDLDFDVVVHLGINEHRSERSVTPRVGVERRDAHQPVNAGLGFQITIGIVACHIESNTLHARFFTRLIIENFLLVAAPVAPAEIHAQQDFRPVLGLGAAGARMERDNGIAPVVRPAE